MIRQMVDSAVKCSKAIEIDKGGLVSGFRFFCLFFFCSWAIFPHAPKFIQSTIIEIARFKIFLRTIEADLVALPKA